MSPIVDGRLVYEIAGVYVDICAACGAENCFCATLAPLEEAPREKLVEALRDFACEAAAQGPVYEWLLAGHGLVDKAGKPE